MRKTQALKDRFMQFVSVSGCWLWTGYRNKDGYGKFQISRSENDLAHRVSWKLFKRAIPVGKCVLHRCDVPACVNPKHLFIGTQRQNVLDMFEKGRANRAKGERNAKARLTTEQALQIKHDPRRTYLVARDHKISWSQADRIKRGINWTHI